MLLCVAFAVAHAQLRISGIEIDTALTVGDAITARRGQRAFHRVVAVDHNHIVVAREFNQLAPVLILVGFKSRVAAAVLAFNMVVAVALAHAGDVFTLGKHGQWGIELQGLYLFGAVAIVLLGAGRYSVSRGAGRWD